MIDRRRLAGALLPVQQRVVFLQDKVQVILLEFGKLAYLAILIDECRPIKVFRQSGVRLHIGKLTVLDFILSALSADKFLGCTDLTHIFLRHNFRYGQFGTPQHKVVEACRLVRHFIK